MGNEGSVTLRQIAEKAGVTRMTASLALRGKSRVSEATRKRVLKVAKLLGYQPDPEVAKLMARIRTKQTAETKACLALLVSGETANTWKRSITETRYVDGVEARARQYGYRVDRFWLNKPGLSGERLSNIIWNRGIEGVIIAPLQGRLVGAAPRTVMLDFDRFASVALSETIEAPDLDRALHDQYTAMLMVLREMAALNYRSVGFVIDHELDLRVNHKWTAAYVYYRQQAGRKQMPPPLILPSVKQAAFDRWFDRYRPDAIVSVAHIGLDLLLARGLDIPGEVGYASLDVDGAARVYPGASGIDQQSELVGAAAVDMVVSAIQRGQRGVPLHPVRTQVEGAWVSGASAVRQPKDRS